MTLRQITQLSKQKNVKHYSLQSRQELLSILDIPYEEPKHCYIHLKKVRTQPRKITLTDHETGEEYLFKLRLGMKNQVKDKNYSNWILIEGKKYIISYY